MALSPTETHESLCTLRSRTDTNVKALAGRVEAAVDCRAVVVGNVSPQEAQGLRRCVKTLTSTPASDFKGVPRLCETAIP